HLHPCTKQNQLSLSYSLESFPSCEITSEPFKRPPMRLDVPPYAHPASPVKRTSGHGYGRGEAFKTGLAKRRPRPSPARVQVRILGRGLSSVFRVSYLPLLYVSNTAMTL